MDNAAYVAERTDKYFSKTRRIVEMHSDMPVTYAVFIRRDVVAAVKLAVDFIHEFCPEAKIVQHFEEGALVPPKAKLLSITAPFSKFVELETIVLQKTGVACVSAYNAYRMCLALPKVSFLDMHGRHATGDDMVISAAYGASVGSYAAKKQGAKGFIGTSNDLTAHFYGTEQGLGTMPHAVVGYAGHLLKKEWDLHRGDAKHYSQVYSSSDEYARACGTLNSVQLYIESNVRDSNITALVDYYGKEITDSIMVAKWFYDPHVRTTHGKHLSVRLDTHGGRFLEGLDYNKSVETVAAWLKVSPADEYAVVRRVIGDETFDAAGDPYIDEVRKTLFGTGVSAAAIIAVREALDKAGYEQVGIVASSGFDLFKCQIMAAANAPINVVGTGSFLPKTLSETYATCDIIAYNGTPMVKVGREFLFG